MSGDLFLNLVEQQINSIRKALLPYKMHMKIPTIVKIMMEQLEHITKYESRILDEKERTQYEKGTLKAIENLKVTMRFIWRNDRLLFRFAYELRQ